MSHSVISSDVFPAGVIAPGSVASRASGLLTLLLISP